VRRRKAPREKTVKVRAGRKRYWRRTGICTQIEGYPTESHALGYVPPGGNQFTSPAKRKIRSVPVKNTGRPRVARDVVVCERV